MHQWGECGAYRQLTQDGCVGFLKQASSSYFSFARCLPEKGSVCVGLEAEGGGAGNGINAICSITDTLDPQCLCVLARARLKTICCSCDSKLWKGKTAQESFLMSLPSCRGEYCMESQLVLYTQI